MWTNLVFFAPIFTFLIASYVSARADNDVCMSPNGSPGKCLNIKVCPDLLNLLQQKPLTESTTKFLQQSQCGYENRDPKVCCTNSDNQFNSSRLLDDPKSVPMSVENHPNLRLLGGGKQCARIVPVPVIFGGTITRLDDYPWMALLAYRNDRRLISQTGFKCGGSIINKRYILTAAHCVTGLDRNVVLYGVRVGEYDLSTEKDCGNNKCRTYQDFLIESYHYHPKYSAKTIVNDIALIRVNRDIDLTVANAKPICLPITSDLKSKDYEKMTVAGWGFTEANKTSSVLLEVSVPRFLQDECVNIYKRNGLPITPKQLCYGGEPGKDSCRGDSGGPLFSDIYGYYVQYGIVSYGPLNCGKALIPGVYTRVDQYVDWILDNLRD